MFAWSALRRDGCVSARCDHQATRKATNMSTVTVLKPATMLIWFALLHPPAIVEVCSKKASVALWVWRRDPVKQSFVDPIKQPFGWLVYATRQFRGR